MNMRTAPLDALYAARLSNADQTCNRGDVDDRATLGILIFHHLDRFPGAEKHSPRY